MVYVVRSTAYAMRARSGHQRPANRYLGGIHGHENAEADPAGIPPRPAASLPSFACARRPGLSRDANRPPRRIDRACLDSDLAGNRFADGITHSHLFLSVGPSSVARAPAIQCRARVRVTGKRADPTANLSSFVPAAVPSHDLAPAGSLLLTPARGCRDVRRPPLDYFSSWSDIASIANEVCCPGR